MKSNARELIIFEIKNFLNHFSIGLIIFSLPVLIFSFEFVNKKLIYFLTLSALFYLLFFWIEKYTRENFYLIKLRSLTKYLVIITTLTYLSTKDNMSPIHADFSFIIAITLIYITLYLFYIHREYLQTSNQIKYSKLTSVLTLVVIICGLFFYQYPYINQKFFDNLNSEKYVSYIPTAQNIIETKNPFTFKNGNYTDLEQSVAEQNFPKYWELPIYFWVLAVFQIFVPYITIEAAAHGAMFFLGSILLVLMYGFLRIFFEPRYSYFAIIIFGISPIFTLLSRLTTFDTIALIFFFAAIYSHHKNNTPLALILLSFSVLSKLSFGLIGAIYFMVLFLTEKKYSLFPKLVGNLAILFISFQLLIAPIPSYSDQMLVALLLILTFAATCLTVYKLTHAFEFNLVKIIFDKRLYIISTPLFIILVLVWKNNILNIASQFLVSPSQLINLPLYDVLFQRILIVTSPIGSFFSFLIFAPLLISKIRNNPYFLALLVSSFFYLIIAAKSIRYAYYYNHIFVLVLVILVTYLVMFFNNIYFKDRIKTQNIYILGILALCLFFMNSSHHLVWKVHPKLVNAENVIEYVNNNSSADDKILILDTEFQTLFQYTNRAVIVITAIRNTPERSRLDELKAEIQTNGFYETMKKYNVKFLITDRRNDDFGLFNYLLTTRDVPDPLDRNQLIYGGSEIDQETLKTNARIYFQLEKTFGQTKVYRLVESSLIN